MQLARAGFAYAHASAGLTERHRLGVVTREHFALARRQQLERALDAPAQVVRVEACVDAVVGRQEGDPIVLNEAIERQHPRLEMGIPSRTRALAGAAELVDDRPADAQARVRLEGDAAAGLEAVDRVDESQDGRRRQVVVFGERAVHEADALRECAGKNPVALDERPACRRVARPTTRPQLGRVHASPPPPPLRPTPAPCGTGPSGRRGRLTVPLTAERVNPRSGTFRIPVRAETFSSAGDL